MIPYFQMKLLSILFAIFLFAFALRVYNLGTVPVGLHGDEASIGYNAYSLLKTGRDQNGNFLPIAIDQFGDFRPAGYHYIAIPAIALFGLTEFATRFPAALFGALTIFPMFWFSRQIFKNDRIAFAAAFLLTITPWHINISRSTSESIIALFLIMLGSFFFLKSFEKPINHRLILISLALFAGSFFFYHAARLFAPLLFAVFSVTLFFSQKLKRKHIMVLAGYNAVLIAVLLLVFALGKGASRPLAVSILTSQDTTVTLTNQIRQDGQQNTTLTRFFHNKPVGYIYTFTNNYLAHLNTDFLFIKGGFPSRYIIPWTGNLYPIFLPFLLIGFSFLLVELIQSKKYINALVLTWFLIGPIPAALTFEDIPNVQRSIMMLPAAILIVAYGFDKSFGLLANKRAASIFVVVISTVLLHNFFSFAHNYFRHSFTERPWYRNAGEKELVLALAELQTQYDKIITTSANDNNIIFYLFYRKLDPSYYQGLGSPRDKNGLVFENMTFTYDHCTLKPEDEEPEKESIVFVNIEGCKIPKQGKLLREIKRPDDTTIFRIYGVNPLPSKM